MQDIDQLYVPEILLLPYVEKKLIAKTIEHISALPDDEGKIEFFDKLVSSGTTKIERVEKKHLVHYRDVGLYGYLAIATGTHTYWNGAEWKEQLRKHRVLWVCDRDSKFQFIIEPHNDNKLGSLICAETNPDRRGSGLFKELLEAIRHFSFDILSLQCLHARANIPRTNLFEVETEGLALANNSENTDDWRLETYQVKSRKFKPVNKPTKLFNLWCKHKYIYPRVVFDSLAGADEFLIFSEYAMRLMPRQQARELEASYPKHESQRFNYKSFNNW